MKNDGRTLVDRRGRTDRIVTDDVGDGDGKGKGDGDRQQLCRQQRCKTICVCELYSNGMQKRRKERNFFLLLCVFFFFFPSSRVGADLVL
jgi:hypothetical protein